jgi:hypothetical protein
MGLIQWLSRRTGFDLIRLEILMDYSNPIKQPGTNSIGTAAVRWSTLSHELPPATADFFRAALIAALYAEVLVIDADNRTELTARVDTAYKRWIAQTNNEGKPTNQFFDEWNTKVAGVGVMPIWPWRIVEPKVFEDMIKLVPPVAGNPLTYTATLKSISPVTKTSEPDKVWAFTEMGIAQMKVCVPASPLIAAHAFVLECFSENKFESVFLLFFLMDQVNCYYQKIGKFPIGKQSEALAAALAAAGVVLRQ